jgi:hypothetical protein
MAFQEDRNSTCRIGKVLESDIELFHRVVASDSGEHLSHTLAYLAEQSRVIGAVHTDLAFYVEELAVEQCTHLGRLIARYKDGLTQELGSEKGAMMSYRHGNRFSGYDLLLIRVPRLQSRDITSVGLLRFTIDMREYPLRDRRALVFALPRR